MIGLEPAEPSVQVAKQHAARDPILQDRLTYECTTLEEYVGRAGTEQVDLVVASEVIEHVANPPLFAHNVCKLVKVQEGLCLVCVRVCVVCLCLCVWCVCVCVSGVSVSVSGVCVCGVCVCVCVCVWCVWCVCLVCVFDVCVYVVKTLKQLHSNHWYSLTCLALLSVPLARRGMFVYDHQQDTTVVPCCHSDG